jgi:hypothetical protein
LHKSLPCAQQAQDRCRDGAVLLFVPSFCAGPVQANAGQIVCQGKKRRTVAGCPPGLDASGIYLALLSCRQVDLVDEWLKEDRRGNRTLGDLVGAAGVHDGEVRDADEAEDDAEVGAFEVVGLQR